MIRERGRLGGYLLCWGGLVALAWSAAMSPLQAEQITRLRIPTCEPVNYEKAIGLRLRHVSIPVNLFNHSVILSDDRIDNCTIMQHGKAIFHLYGTPLQLKAAVRQKGVHLNIIELSRQEIDRFNHDGSPR